jgi:hypothetical protein
MPELAPVMRTVFPARRWAAEGGRLDIFLVVVVAGVGTVKVVGGGVKLVVLMVGGNGSRVNEEEEKARWGCRDRDRERGNRHNT